MNNPILMALMAIYCLLTVQPILAQNNLEITNATAFPIAAQHIDGRFFIHLEKHALYLSDLKQSLNDYLGHKDQYSFKPINESEDQLGFTHAAYRQYYKGVFVEDGLVLLHAKNGVLSSFNGIVGKLPEGFSVQPLIVNDEAISLAKDGLQLREIHNAPDAILVISRNNPEDKYVLTYKVNLQGVTKEGIYTHATVFVDALTGTVLNKISLMATAAVQGLAHTLYSGVQEITMDSYAGGYRLRDELRDIITMNFDKATVSSSGLVQNLADYTNVTTTWESVLSLDSVRLLTIGDSGLIQNNRAWTPAAIILDQKVSQLPIQGPVKDKSRPNSAPFIFSNMGYSLLLPPYLVAMSNYNNANGKSSGRAYFYIDSGAISEGYHDWSDTLGNGGEYIIRKRTNPALDAHWGMARTYDYFKETFGRHSYDGRKGPITNLINGAYTFTGTQANAAALNNGANGIMVFGLGDREKMNDVVCLDVLGHEFAHMVTMSNGHGGLVYQGESGALNESFSDIFGTCIEFYAKKNRANWTLGDEAFLTAPGMYRSLAEPKLTSCPDTYQGNYWINPAQVNNDNGGVHINSGIQNKWFYLLSEGGKGTNDKSEPYDVNPIGLDKAQQIAYRNLMNYLTPYASYVDACRGSIQATEDLYGAEGPEMVSVKMAWFAVGLDPNTTGFPQAKTTSDLVRTYPNPASERIHLIVTALKPEQMVVRLNDIMGRTVLEKKATLSTAGEHHLQMDINSLADGIYFINMSSDVRNARQRITVRH